MKVEFYRHALGEEEIASVVETLHSVFLTAGPKTRAFEAAFAEYLGIRRVVGFSSCTTALWLTLRALGIGPGDEVITTPMTFIATANAILEAGGTPVFVDVEASTGNLDAERVAAAITPRTKAILPVHLYGQMCDMRRLRVIADQHNLAIIEDAAHCVEGERDGVRPGQLGDAACFSFYATKNLCSGEGGAVATQRDDLAEQLLLCRSHGMDKGAAERHHGRYQHWDMVCLGQKANMFDIQAALLLPQIPKISRHWQRRSEIVASYESALTGVPGVTLHRMPLGSRHARHLFTILVPPSARDPFLAQLQAFGIGCTVNYRAIHLLSYYRQRFNLPRGSFPVAEEIGDCTVSLPLWVGLQEHEIRHVIDGVRSSLKQVTRKA
ncbi:MAG: DegT/DnrJ/EryC1/StrS aminotransferase family protein [Magnetococcales bacterium]|nr:DegT/DnrJ/EryC1/StrS aminotransferase family protein [Magnetococcales bacterium]